MEYGSKKKIKLQTKLGPSLGVVCIAIYRKKYGVPLNIFSSVYSDTFIRHKVHAFLTFNLFP